MQINAIQTYDIHLYICIPRFFNTSHESAHQMHQSFHTWLLNTPSQSFTAVGPKP